MTHEVLANLFSKEEIRKGYLELILDPFANLRLFKDIDELVNINEDAITAASEVLSEVENI